jgi:hypothetical protein
MDDQICPIMISFFHSWPGCTEAPCMTCGATVYEQQENLDRIREMEGWVICLLCALELKQKCPEFPGIDAQMWKGHMREPNVLPAFKKLVELLKK